MSQCSNITKIQIDIAKQLYEVTEMWHFKAVSWSISLDKVHQWTQEKLAKWSSLSPHNEISASIQVSNSAQKKSSGKLNVVKKGRPVSSIWNTPKVKQIGDLASAVYVHEFSDLTIDQIKSHIQTL